MDWRRHLRAHDAARLPWSVGRYALKAGSVSIHYSGDSIVGDARCNISGSTFVDLFQDAGGSMGQSGRSGEAVRGGPAQLLRQRHPRLRSRGRPDRVIVRRPNHNGTVHADFPVGAIHVFDTRPAELQSPDGIHYNGTYSDNQGGVTTESTWVLTGAKDPP